MDDVHFAYPAEGPHTATDTEALAGVSLDICAGEHVCILGSNGSGKSTLIQLMNGLLRATSGTVEVLGIDASDVAGALSIRRRAAMVFQHPDDQMVTSIVADDVAFGPENLGVPQPEIVRRVDEALAAVGMERWAQADPSDLSGGQRQRVAIAGALAMRPEILLLDEPAAMLDAGGRVAIQGIISRLKERGITIVHVTHFMDDALRADRVVVLERGRIVLDGAPLEVFEHRETVRRLGLESPFTVKVADGLADIVPDLPLTADMDAAASAVAAALRTRATSTPHDEPRETRPSSAQGDGPDAIVFDRVSFSYADDPKPRRRLLGRRERARRVPLALDAVSFSCRAGSLTALVGCTGSGKSTTVELACALKMPREGRVVIQGVDTRDRARRPEVRSAIGYVAQLPEHQLFAETVFEDVAFGPRNLGISEDEVARRVHEALGAAGIDPTEEMLRRSPFSLSGGQQRSVAIAGVLAMRTPILVLDEPMAGLDPAGRTRMRALIGRIKQAGTTILIVTHSMDDVARLADNVVVLDQGRLVDEGTPGYVFGRTPCRAPGIPTALAFARRLAVHGYALAHAPLTITALLEEVRHGAAR